ncbi:hypothetical protein [Thiohalobacter sp.]|uniref:hypothetical protein n=1 Tax=Thiohalobacter sp. TaxID=2025948 RepID=UPI002631EE95|nr:hypothetical protein [Thiohalobacter sp.]
MSMQKVRLLSLLLGLLPAGIGAAPPLVSVSAPVTLGAPRGLHYSPDVVALHEGYVVVWQRGQDHAGGPGAGLELQVLDASANPRRPVTTLCDAAGSQEHPRLASNGRQGLVVWQDFRNGHDWDVYAARLDAGGEPHPGCGLVLATGSANAALPVAATAGRRGFLVVWQQTDDHGFYRLHAALVPPAGKVRFLGPVLNQAPDAADWHGYTPGWGTGRQPLRAGQQDALVLTGGRAEVIETDPEGGAWFLTWHDEANWAPGNRGGITRRVARLELRGDRLVATAVSAAPSNGLARNEGGLARNGDRVLLTGRSIINRGNSHVSGAILPADRLAFLPNPNTEPRKFGAGWDPSRVFSLFRAALGMEGPVAATAFGAGFLVAAVGDSRAGSIHARRIIGNFIDREGRRLLVDGDWPVLHQGEALPSHPVLAGRGKTALLVFEQRRGADRLIQARLIRGAVP